MTKNKLYVYKGTNGEIWSPVLLPMEYTLMYRLIADTDKELTDGTQRVSVIDVVEADVDKWSEVEKEVSTDGTV